MSDAREAANANGPRYDPQQSPEERHGFENLILLCANHHKTVDDDEVAYTVERLTAMKRDHENSATPLPEGKVDAAVILIQSTGQTGGITAQTFKAENIHFHASTESADMHHYNEERLHAALGYMAPAIWHRGRPNEVRDERARRIAAARAHRRMTNQQRFTEAA